MCKVIVVNKLKELSDAIEESRLYIARGLFYRDQEGVKVYKEKHNERTFDGIDIETAIPPYILHCRQPTSGTPNNHKNNHPFMYPRGSDCNVIGCQVGFTSTNRYMHLCEGLCDSESAIIALSLDSAPLEFCRENVEGQLFFFMKGKTGWEFFTYNADLKGSYERMETYTIGGDKAQGFMRGVGQYFIPVKDITQWR